MDPTLKQLFDELPLAGDWYLSRSQGKYYAYWQDSLGSKTIKIKGMGVTVYEALNNLVTNIRRG